MQRTGREGEGREPEPGPEPPYHDEGRQTVLILGLGDQLSAISPARWILKRDRSPTMSGISDGRVVESCGPWEVRWPVPPQGPIRRHELVNKCEGGSTLQPVALSGKYLSEGQ